MAFGSWQVLLGGIGFFFVLGVTIRTDQNWIAQELDGSYLDLLQLCFFFAGKWDCHNRDQIDQGRSVVLPRMMRFGCA